MNLRTTYARKLEQLKARSEDGFTLIELIVVVAVIGILMSVALPLFGTIQENTRQATGANIARNAYLTILTAQQDNDPETDQASVLAQLANNDNIVYVNDWTNEFDLCVTVVWNPPVQDSIQSYGPECEPFVPPTAP